MNMYIIIFIESSKMFKMFYSIQNINNGILLAKKAMPQKDSTSTNEGSFAMARHTYTDTYPTVAVTNAQKVDKKWFGNRDSSQVTANRRNNQIGVGTLNVNSANNSKGAMSFTTVKDVNYTTQALHRVRSGGSVAPAKKNVNKQNAPTPSFAPAGPKKEMYGLKTPVLFH